jgi:uncharacterized membrane protein YhaH (DUF805 family)
MRNRDYQLIVIFLIFLLIAYIIVNSTFIVNHGYNFNFGQFFLIYLVLYGLLILFYIIMVLTRKKRDETDDISRKNEKIWGHWDLNPDLQVTSYFIFLIPDSHHRELLK